MGEPIWIERWRDVIATKPELPGVWRRRDGGYHVRTRVRDPRTGRRREINRALPEVARAKDAMRWLDDEAAKIRDGLAVDGAAHVPQFHTFAATVFERKVKLGRIRSAAGRRKWKWVMESHLIPEFGDLFVDQMRPADIKAWQTKVASKMAPATGNTILGVLRQITDEAVDDFELRDPMRGVDPFDTRAHRTYTHEEPNAIRPVDVPRFLAEMRTRYPQHYAFVFLGFTTGLRPSSLRPLRRAGANADVKWNEGRLFVRRSHTRGNEVMDGTKTSRDQVIDLDPEQLAVLRWHVDQLERDNLRRDRRSPHLAAAMRTSELLFPAAPRGAKQGGGFRSSSCLDKAFADVAKVLELGYDVSPRCMRRTFQDLAREASIGDVVTRSISGHATPEMQRRYSTVSGDEMRVGLGKVIDIATGRERLAA